MHSLRALVGRSIAPLPTPAILGPEAVPALAARYQLVKELGRGATGTVYLARDQELGREVAIKRLHAHVARDAKSIARFFAEARVAASLRHPGIIAILDLDERHLRIVMELARGGTLQTKLAIGPLTLSDALERTSVLGALPRRAHAERRPPRPQRPTLFRERTARVLGDFGVAHSS